MTSVWLRDAAAIPTDPFAQNAEYDEVIVGAGITGLVTGLLLARSGRRVAVVEARTVGAGTTGNTTAKVTQLQGTQLQKVRSHGTPRVLQAYADGTRSAFDWLIDYAEARGIPVDRRDAVSFAATAEGTSKVRREFELARSVGLDVRMIADAGLPFPTWGAVSLAGQAQLDPMHLLAALAADLRALGGVIHEGARVLSVRASSPTVIDTSLGQLRAGRVILATGTPILDRGLYFAKVSVSRSYAQAFEVAPGSLPEGMFINVEQPTTSVRTHGALLLTGGFGHPVGREASPKRRADELTEWTQRHWPGARLTHSWSAQDYSAAHHVPFVGWMPRGRGRLYLATGFDKWGLTGGVAAALTIAADLVGENTEWQRTLHHRVTMPRAVARGIGENAAVGWWYAKGYARALTTLLPVDAPDEGAGVVGRSGLRPRAVSTVDGVRCELSALCSHLGAVVTWNDAERSWDCPAHGSRFAADGTRIEGPATRDLAG